MFCGSRTSDGPSSRHPIYTTTHAFALALLSSGLDSVDYGCLTSYTLPRDFLAFGFLDARSD